MTIKQRPRARFATFLALLLAVAVIMPTAAGAYEVTQSSTRPNGFAGQDTYGGIPTRLTWKLKIEKGDAGVQGVVLELPEGTDLTKSVVEVAVLKGISKTPVAPTVTLEGKTVGVVLNESVDSSEAISYLRVEVEDLVLPVDGGQFDVTGSIATSAGAVPVPPAKEQIEFKKMTLAESIIFWLDQQPWVAAWNSVKILRMFFNPQLIVASIFVEFRGWLLAILLVLIGFPLAIPAGLLLAFAKMSKLAPIRWISSFYINVIRGTPLFLQIYIAFFGLPLIGIQANKIVLGVIVLALNSSAYLAEIFRAGIQSISKGQFEAASSLGMSYTQAMQHIIVPQTVKRVLPTMTSEFILLYKDTAMLSAVGVFELMMYSKNLAAIAGNITPYVVAAGFYLMVTTPLIAYVRTLEERLAVAEGGAAADKPKKKKRAPKWRPDKDTTDTALLGTSAQHESR
jgi:polar amino acid transport system substrate-binding protein